MKNITLLLAFILSLTCNSQSENLVDVTWRCTNIVIGGDIIEVPNNDEVTNVLLYLIQDSNPFTEDFVSGVCNYLSSSDGIVTYNDPEMTFTISQLVQTLIICDSAENDFFESNYFGFYYNSLNTPLSYATNTIGDLNTLTITTPNGDKANYDELVLNVQENELKLVTIYPNPASENIHINSKATTIDRIEIYSITGRILKSIKGSISTIDISNLSKGTYFLKFYSADNFMIKQLVKK